MYKKVYYVVKSELHYYPPCLSQIRMLNDAGVDVTAVYGSSKSTAIDILKNDGIECVELVDTRGKFKGKLDKIYNWWTYRRSLVKYLKTIDRKSSLLWFGNVESYLPLLGHLNKYHTAVSFLELLHLRSFKSWLMGKIVKKNVFITACEETRSYIMRDNWSLDKLPYIIPNKPYRIDVKKNATPTILETQKTIEELKGSRFVIYQGILWEGDYLIEMATALYEKFPDYYFVLMGIDRTGVIDKLKSINKKIIYIPYIPAPLHLEITSHAHIGLLFYEPADLNRAFCAPNKIYEYSSFGIPMIGNNIPGLLSTIEVAHAGICCDLSKENIITAIKYIESNYDTLYKNSLKLYNSTDLMKLTKQIVKENNIICNKVNNK